MERKEFRDPSGRLLFYTEERSGSKQVRDAGGRLLGTLGAGQTRDAEGRLVGQGEEAAVLYERSK